MKSLKDYIYESSEEIKTNGERNVDSKEGVKEAKPVEPKDFKLNFKNLEGAKEELENLVSELQKSGFAFENEEEVITLNLGPNDKDKFKSVLDILHKYVKTIRFSPKRSSNEQYAQLTKKFEESVKKIETYFESEVSNEEE